MRFIVAENITSELEISFNADLQNSSNWLIKVLKLW
jgi:hypothetical protein